MRRKHVLALGGYAVIAGLIFGVIWFDGGFDAAVKVALTLLVPMPIAFWIGWILAGD